MKSEVNFSIHVNGIVQGVGFRPFVYNLAHQFGLKGWVKNTSAGVDIELNGSNLAIQEFIERLTKDAPPLAQIDDVLISEIPEKIYPDFQIVQSTTIPTAFQPISADVSTCLDCLSELYSPDNRRYLYPFINCTNCGPRFTIIKDIPYDRPNTTMSSFKMCDACSAEYNNPLDRRFHAEPIACPDCGPHIWLEEVNNTKFSIIAGHPEVSLPSSPVETIIKTQQLLLEGKIIAIKGLGGFHLACDAKNKQAIETLRTRKFHVEKALALMMLNLSTIDTHCICEPTEIDLLKSRNKPIVILRRKQDSYLPENIAPNQNTLGVMLPYTPLHYLLFHQFKENPSLSISNRITPSDALVMTSGNISEEPIAISNEDAKRHLIGIADYFLFHNREIQTRCDDSVLRYISPKIRSQQRNDKSHENSLYFIRRSRGYAPNPISLTWDSIPILATGTELKNTFCVAQGHYAFMSHHIGDLENFETLKSFEEGIDHFEQLFRIRPEIIAHDFHPNYLATRYALKRSETENLPLLGIQHHHAHIASCMVDNETSYDKKVFGVSLDGTGYGIDNNIWGGEFMLADYTSFDRLFHLDYFPLPGGEISIKKPARTALAYLWKVGIDWASDLPPVMAINSEERKIIKTLLENSINTPVTSSMGRLFDAIAGIIGIRSVANYEAQAAIELESISEQITSENYSYAIVPSLPKESIKSGKILLDDLIREIVNDYRNNKTISFIGGKFHHTIALIILDACNLARESYGVNDIVLSGGVWQNILLLEQTLKMLKDAGFNSMIHNRVPTNDAGVSLGQAAIAYHQYKQTPS